MSNVSKKSFGRLALCLVFSSIFISAFSSPVHADGMIIRPDPYRDRWDYGEEKSQRAYINLEDGVQKMLMSIEMEDTPYTSAVWIFPVPANPEKVTIDVLTEFPQLRGEDISKLAERSLTKIRRYLLGSQIYPLPFLAIFRNLASVPMDVGGVRYDAVLQNDAEEKSDVVVHETLTKEGLTTELLTAKTSTGLYNYLKDKGLTVDVDSIPAFGAYIGEDYSFVVTWIAGRPDWYYSPTKYSSGIERPYAVGVMYDEGDEAAIGEATSPTMAPEDTEVESDMIMPPRYPTPIPPIYTRFRGVFITFPTDKMYYPLVPTSVYDSKKVPATVRVLGHVSPRIFNDIKAFTDVEYYYDKYARLDKDFYRQAAETRSDKIKYTKIEIDAPSKLLTEDLWISPRTPAHVSLLHMLSVRGYIYALLVLISASLIAGVCAGLIFFRKTVSLAKMALLGLANCFSLIGVMAAIAFVRTNDKDDGASEVMSKLKSKGYVWKRRLAALLAVINLPFVLMLVAYLLFGPRYIVRNTFRDFSVPIPLLVPFVLAYVIHLLAKVKDDDRELFKQLKQKGYSVWTMATVDPKKLFYVPVFSAFFVLLIMVADIVMRLFV